LRCEGLAAKLREIGIDAQAIRGGSKDTRLSHGITSIKEWKALANEVGKKVAVVQGMLSAIGSL